MIQEVRLALALLVIGILLINAHYTALLPLNTVDGRVKQDVKNVNFEIFDCTVQGNSTYEKSGTCPDSASEALPDGSATSEKVVTNTNSDVSQEPKADSSTSTDVADTETKPDVSQEPKADSSTSTDVADTETKPDVSQEPKADSTGSSHLSDDTNQQSPTMTSERYDFDQIHITGPESSRENIERSQPDSDSPSETLTPLDPFGPSVRYGHDGNYEN